MPKKPTTTISGVSAIIPCLNSAAHLVQVIGGIKRQTVLVDEILVVDGGSTDATRALAESLGCKVILQTNNLGLGAARNLGAMKARNELLAYIDSDVLVGETWLEVLIASILKTGAVQAGGSLEELHHEKPADKWRAIHLPQDNGSEAKLFTKESQGRLAGFASIIFKSALMQVGLYNELFGRSYEDVDLSRRLIEAGFSLAYEPVASAQHLRRDTVGSVLRSAWSWDFWPQMLDSHYDGPLVALKSISRNLFWSFQLVVQDTALRQCDLIVIDLFLAVAYTFWDFRFISVRKFKALERFAPNYDLGNLAEKKSPRLSLGKNRAGI